MEMRDAAAALSALAHEGRLTIFRELVQAGPDGLAAGNVARNVGIAPNTLSASLTVLGHAGLVRSRRAGRSIIYTASFEQMADLLAFLIEDCCNGSPEICMPLAEIATRATCCGSDEADERAPA